MMNMRDAITGKVVWEASVRGDQTVFTEEKTGLLGCFNLCLA